MSTTKKGDFHKDKINPLPEASFIKLETIDVLMQARATPNWSKEYIQISQGFFEGSLTDISLGPVQLFREKINRAVDQSAQAWKNCLTVGIPIKTKDGGFWCGDTLDSDSIIFIKPNAELKFRSPQYSDIYVAAIDVDLLKKHDETTGEIESLDLSLYHGVVPAPKKICQTLRSSFHHILEGVSKNPDSLKQPAVRQELLSEVTGILHSSLYDLGEIQPHNSYQFVHRHIVEKAKEYILSRNSPPSVLEICQELRVSRRILHYAFQKVLAINPVTFLRYIRLHGVRSELMATPPGKLLISEIAYKWGFWTPALFSSYYRELFGETPTETLKKTNKKTISLSTFTNRPLPHPSSKRSS